MKAHEETWRLAREGSRTLLCGDDIYPAADFYDSEGDGRIALAAAAPEMARLLIGFRERCEREPDLTPYDAEAIDAVLRKAGVLP